MMEIERKKEKLKLKGSIEAGDRIHRIMGMRKNNRLLDRKMECLCEWKPRNEQGTEFPLTSFVPASFVRDHYPLVFSEFF